MLCISLKTDTCFAVKWCRKALPSFPPKKSSHMPRCNGQEDGRGAHAPAHAFPPALCGKKTH